MNKPDARKRRDTRFVATLHLRRKPFEMLEGMQKIHQWCLWKLPPREFPNAELKAFDYASRTLIHRMEKRRTELTPEEAERLKSFYLQYMHKVRDLRLVFLSSEGRRSMKRKIYERTRTAKRLKAELDERRLRKTELAKYEVAAPRPPIPPPKPFEP